ncbi:hypothetical protein J4474_02450 [Candidatus Pacearchaeota archaeon]|nr:hypothetical protein [Candidatus Pacearchaeota archaeon]
MLSDLIEALEKLDLARDLDLTRIHQAPSEGSGIVFNAEVRIAYAGGNKKLISTIMGTLRRMAVMGYSIKRNTPVMGDFKYVKYICVLPNSTGPIIGEKPLED